MNHTIDLLVGQLSRIGRYLVLIFLTPGFKFGGCLAAPSTSGHEFFHVAGRDDERGGAAMAGDGYWFALNSVEQLAKLVLRFGGCFGDHGAVSDIAIIANLAKIAIHPSAEGDTTRGQGAKWREIRGEGPMGISLARDGALLLEDGEQVGVGAVPANGAVVGGKAITEIDKDPGLTRLLEFYDFVTLWNACLAAIVFDLETADPIHSLRVLVAPEGIEVEIAGLVRGLFLLLVGGEQLDEFGAEDGGLAVEDGFDVGEAAHVEADGVGAFGVAVPVPVVEVLHESAAGLLVGTGRWRVPRRLRRGRAGLLGRLDNFLMASD